MTTDGSSPRVSAGGYELGLGESLRRQSLTSPSGEFTLIHQHDGNLVLYRTAHWRAMWATNTNGRGLGRCELTPEGELVLTGARGERLWSASTAGRDVQRLEVRDDGNVVLLDREGTVRWSTGTFEGPVKTGTPARGDRMLPGQSLSQQSLSSPSGAYVLTHDGGDLILVRNGYGIEDPGEIVWSSRALGTGGYVLREDGELVGYHKSGEAVWTSGTAGHPGSTLVLGDNGIAVISSADGTPIWSTGPLPTARISAAASETPGGASTPVGPAVDTGFRLPRESGTLVVRTDFGDEDAWRTVRAKIEEEEPDHGLTFVDDPTFEGATARRLAQLASADPENTGVLFVVDAVTLASADHLVLTVDLAEDEIGENGVPDRCEPFRAVPEKVFPIAANVMIGNLWLAEFAEGVDETGVLWG
jgi:hypothetical protein